MINSNQHYAVDNISDLENVLADMDHRVHLYLSTI